MNYWIGSFWMSTFFLKNKENEIQVTLCACTSETTNRKKKISTRRKKTLKNNKTQANLIVTAFLTWFELKFLIKTKKIDIKKYINK